MSSMTYKGLCVGGPLAGQWLSSYFCSFSASEPDGNSFRRCGHDTLAGCTYVHCVIDDVCEFWVPEGRDENWALREIVRTYRRSNLATVAGVS